MKQSCHKISGSLSQLRMCVDVVDTIISKTVMRWNEFNLMRSSIYLVMSFNN